MLWFLYFVLAFGFGLGMWEFIAIKDAMRLRGTATLEVATAAGMPEPEDEPQAEEAPRRKPYVRSAEGQERHRQAMLSMWERRRAAARVEAA